MYIIERQDLPMHASSSPSKVRCTPKGVIIRRRKFLSLYGFSNHFPNEQYSIEIPFLTYFDTFSNNQSRWERVIFLQSQMPMHRVNKKQMVFTHLPHVSYKHTFLYSVHCHVSKNYHPICCPCDSSLYPISRCNTPPTCLLACKQRRLVYHVRIHNISV